MTSSPAILVPGTAPGAVTGRTDRTLAAPFLALDLDGDGAHPAAAHESRHDPAALYTGALLADRVRAAEAAGFHVVTVGDGPLDATASAHPGRLAAIHAAAYAAPLTGRIAVVPVADAVYTEPFHLATQLMALDHVSHGRAGWIVYGTGDRAEARTVGRNPLTPAEVRREVADVLEVARRTWDSWEDDAVIRDVPSGRYLDASRLHYVDFEGESFSVKGPSITPRSPQGQLPVLATADLADPTAVDGLLVTADTPEDLPAAVLRARAAGARIVVAELAVALDARGRSAADRLTGLARHGRWEPETALAAGDTDRVVDVLAKVLAVADGVRLHPAVIDQDLPELAAAVLPALRRRVPLAELPIGGTFRDLLQLPHPRTRYAARADRATAQETR